MKTIAYLDCTTGISGDMCLAALIDAGVPLDYLQTRLATLGLDSEFTLTVNSVLRQGLRALKAQVDLANSPATTDTIPGHDEHRHHPSDVHNHCHVHGPHHHTHRPPHGLAHDAAHRHEQPGELRQESHLPVDKTARPASKQPPITKDSEHHPPVPAHPLRTLPIITRLISQADLPPRAKQWSLAIFHRLAEAEAAVHGIAIDQVHFHEVGATDAIVDIVGTCLGLDWLNIDALHCSPLPTGRGRVKAAHGWLPVPAPAVLKLLELGHVPIYGNGLAGELVTPTGAAIVTTLVAQFGPPPPMVLQTTGLGAGTKDLPMANVLRLWLGQSTDGADPQTSSGVVSGTTSSLPTKSLDTTADPTLATILAGTPPLETIVVLETQVDDMVPQAMGYLYDRLLAIGALDVFTQAIGMKKSRPGLLITVICTPETATVCEQVLFQETPTLGIRRQQQHRLVLDRQFQPLTTPYGEVAIKLAYHPQTGQLMNIHPEYEDCAALARAHNIPWQTIYHTALSAWYSQQA
jgi:uncharacterized protein (TIGR00299 family) protein